MFKESDVSSRRIFTFPAIRPGESVALPSLVTSLITLGHAICKYKSKPFITNKRNARNLIRLVEGLVIFLEEFQEGHSLIGNSISLSLSELHFVFQKIIYLLEDCTRNGAKLWMLMKAEEVSEEFRSLARAIAVALDVLPVEELDASVEVKELIVFVKMQAWKCTFMVEMDDVKVANKVQSVLDQFKGGINPEPEDLGMVLEYLDIASWSDCNKEVKFLEGEIGVEWLSEKKKEVGFLSNLMVFMIYCRCTMFDVVDNARMTRFDDECNNEMMRYLNPDDFRCPITLDLMTDPVTLATGHTYDRSSILKWFGSGRQTCPKTGEMLTSAELIPNVSLKRIIKQHCLQNGITFAESGSRKREVTRMVDISSAAAQQAMKLLANHLVGRLMAERSEFQNKIVYEIRLLTKTSIFNRSCLVEAGAIPPLLILLYSMDPSTQENAVAALMNLSKYSGSKKIIVENGGLVLLLEVLQEGLKLEARQHAAGALFYLASIHEYCVMIGEIPEAIPALMDLVRNGTDRGKKNALATIFGLLTYPGNRYSALDAGLVPLLLNLLRSTEREDLVTDSLAILTTLAERPDGTTALLAAGGLHTIVEIFASSTSKTVNVYCVSLLLSLCINGGAEVVRVLVKNPSLMAPLYSLLAQGPPRASKKASTLIRILHEFNEKSSSGFTTAALPQEQPIHVW